jgi:hypothetical protein
MDMGAGLDELISFCSHFQEMMSTNCFTSALHHHDKIISETAAVIKQVIIKVLVNHRVDSVNENNQYDY